MRKLHYWLTASLLLLLWPVCHLTRLRLDMPTYLPGFMVGWVLQSVIWGGLLYQFGVPGAFSELADNWKRLLIAAFIPLLLLPIFGVSSAGLLVCIAALVLLEFYYRGGDWNAVARTALPWAYLALGIQLSLMYSSAAVCVRPFNLYDTFFLRLDTSLGVSVVRISHAASALYGPAEMIYYSIGGVMGAALLFLCLAGDRRAAFQMAGSIVMAYYISLAIFCAWPSHGPFVLAPTGFPPTMVTASAQNASQVNAAALYHHRAWLPMVPGYYVAFPSLHVAQPFIAAWFLRRWRRVSLVVFAYCALLVPAILILQWHYFVDIPGGLLVAAVAIALACGVDMSWLRSWPMALRPVRNSAERSRFGGQLTAPGAEKTRLG